MGVHAQRFPATFSDLALLPPDAELWHGASGMVAARCPLRPDYADGHAVYVPLHSNSTLDEAVHLWDEHVAAYSSSATIRLCVEGSPDALREWADADWRCERRVVLQHPDPDACCTAPAQPNVRRCERLADWEALLVLWSRAHGDDLDGFVIWRAEQLRCKARELAGGMWAWFEGSRALSGAGAYRTGPLWRLQEVMTHPDHRRRGLSRTLCQTLLAAAEGAVPTVVAHPRSPGQRLYESLGFRVVTEQHVLTTRRTNS